MTALPFIQTFFAELVDHGGQAPAIREDGGNRPANRRARACPSPYIEIRIRHSDWEDAPTGKEHLPQRETLPPGNPENPRFAHLKQKEIF